MIKETIKQNKKSILISSVITLLPMLVGFVLWNKLPEQMAIHWGSNGEVDGWANRFCAVVLPPFLMLITHFICILATFLDKKNREQNKKAMKIVFWIVPILSFYVNGMMYATAFGQELDIGTGVISLMGLLFVVIGNYLPKCKRNYTLGIKIKWALANDENWNATHRFAGKVWVLGGILMMIGGFLPDGMSLVIIIGAALVLGFVPMLYSYLYYKKQCKEGTDSKTLVNSTDKKIIKGARIISVFVAAGIAVILFTGKIEYEMGEKSFYIKASYWTDMSVEYEKITNVEYREQDDAGSRTGGFGSAKLLMGIFQNKEFGSYTRYSYTKCDACIVIEMGNRVLVISGKDVGETKEIYELLTQKLK